MNIIDTADVATIAAPASDDDDDDDDDKMMMIKFSVWL